MNATTKYPVLAASRPFSWVNTAFPFLAAWILYPSVSGWHAWLALFFFLFPYNLAMYGINDIFDYESDIKNPRKNSIEGSLLDKSQFRILWKWIVLLNIPIILLLLTQGTFASKVMLLFSCLAVVTYSAPPFRFKEKPFLDSVNSSLHFWTPFAYGILLGFGPASHYQLLSGIWPAALAYFLWGLASHAFGAVQDIPFDKEGGIASIATIFGAKVTILFSTLAYLVSAALCFMYYFEPVGIGAGSIAIAYAANSLRFIGLNDASAPAAHKGWQAFLVLNMASGAFLSTSYLYTIGIFPFVGCMLVTLVTGAVFYAYVSRNKK